MLIRKVALSLLVVAASGVYVWTQAGTTSTGDLLDLSLPASATGGPVLKTSNSIGESAKPLFQPAAAAAEPVATGDAGTTAVGEFDSPADPPPLPMPGTPAPGDVSTTSPTPAVVAVAGVNPVDVPLPRPRPAHQAAVADVPQRRHAVARNLVTPVATTAVAAQRYANGTFTGPVVNAYYGLIQIQAVVDRGRLVGIKVLQYPSDRRTSIFINRQALPMLRDEVVAAQTANVDIISGATLTSEAFMVSLDGALRQAEA